MLKKFVKIFLAVSAGVTLYDCHIADNDITLVMAEVNPKDTVVGRMDTAFKERVESLSNGHIRIDLRFSGILGDEKETMNLIMSKDSPIHLVRGPANLYSYFKYEDLKSKLLSVPYTFKNDEHFWKFAESDIAKEILNEPYEKNLGIKGLFYAQEGLRHYFSSHKLESIEDLKDAKMRTSKGVLEQLANSFHAIPIEVQFTDLYASLYTGKIDVAEQPLTNYISNSFYQVAPNLILDGHMLGAVSVMINSDCWDSLSKNQQKILIEAGKYAQFYCKKIVDEANQEAIEKAKNSRVVVTEVKDIKPWQDACTEMRQNTIKTNPELYEKILDLSK